MYVLIVFVLTKKYHTEVELVNARLCGFVAPVKERQYRDATSRDSRTPRKIKLTLEEKVRHIWIQTFGRDLVALMLTYFCRETLLLPFCRFLPYKGGYFLRAALDTGNLARF